MSTSLLSLPACDATATYVAFCFLCRRLVLILPWPLFQTHQRGAFPWGPVKVQHVDCSKLFAGDPTELARAKTIKLRKVQDPDVTADVNRGCDAFLADNVFINSSLTAEEKNFPVAYSLVVFKDAAQVCSCRLCVFLPTSLVTASWLKLT